MRRIIKTVPAGNDPGSQPGRAPGFFNRFDGTQANTAHTTRLLAALASVAGDHTGDKLARQMIRNATAELFDAAARLDRLGHCGTVPALQLEGVVHGA